jgi:hypothetical protein
MIFDLYEVDARIPIMRHELKDNACANVDGYFRFGYKDFVKAKKNDREAYLYLCFEVQCESITLSLAVADACNSFSGQQ